MSEETIFQVGDWVTLASHVVPIQCSSSLTIDLRREWGDGPFQVIWVTEVTEIAEKYPKSGYGVGHSQWIGIHVNGESLDGGSGKLFKKVDSPTGR